MTPRSKVDEPAREPDVLSMHALHQPQKPAIIEDFPDGYRRTRTYRELNDEANRVANGFIRLGFKPGDRVAWSGRNSADVLIVQQAVRKLGGQSMALNPGLTSSEIQMIFGIVRPAFVWAEAYTADRFEALTKAEHDPTLIVYGPEAADREYLTAAELTAGISADEPRATGPNPSRDIIHFTSGTTGKPRGVIRRPMPPNCSELRLLDEIWGPSSHVFLTSGSMTHGGPGGSAMRALGRGDTVVVQRKFDPVDWLRLVDSYQVSFSYCAPVIVRDVCNLPNELKARYDRSSIRGIIAGAARWPFALKLMYRDDFPADTLWELYGSTELASVTVMRPTEHWGKAESCGKPVPGVDIVLVGSDGALISEPHQPGALYAKSDSMFSGYVDDPTAFAAGSWGDGYFTSGDVGYFDEDGYYYISDRAKDMIVSGGVNIYPAEVEAVVDACPGVFESAVIGVPDDRWGEVVHAVVVVKEPSNLTSDDVIAHCSKYLAVYKMPRSVEFVKELPRSPGGKVRKRELRAPYWERAGRQL